MSLTNDLRACRSGILVPLGLLGLILAAHHLPFGSRAEIRQLSPFVFFLTCPYLGALAFGHEFDSQTLALRLMEPRRRMEVWREKLIAGIVAMLAFALPALVAVYFMDMMHAGASILFPAIWVINSVVAGPALALATRSTLAAAALSFLGGLSQLVTVFVLVQWQLIPAEWESWAALSLSAAYSTWMVAWSWVGWKRCQPGWTGGRFASGTGLPAGFRIRGAHPHRRQPGWNLVRLQLSHVTGISLLGVGLLTLTCVDVACLRAGPAAQMAAAACFPALILLLVLIVPLMVGVAMAGVGRPLGTEHLHATLPLRAARLGWTGAITGLGVSGVIGMVAPAWIEAQAHSYSGWFVASPVTLPLMAAGTLLGFAVGWFSTLATRTAVGATLLGGSLILITLLAWVNIQCWGVPRVTAAVRHIEVNPVEPWSAPAWGVSDLSVVLAHEPAWLLGYTAATLATLVGLLAWSVHRGRYQHVPRTHCIVAFLLFLGLFGATQFLIGLWICMRHLQA